MVCTFVFQDFVFSCSDICHFTSEIIMGFIYIYIYLNSFVCTSIWTIWGQQKDILVNLVLHMKLQKFSVSINLSFERISLDACLGKTEWMLSLHNHISWSLKMFSLLFVGLSSLAYTMICFYLFYPYCV